MIYWVMIFTRRVIQRCIDEMRYISREELEALLAKLNEPSPARLPAMWEVAILHALASLGTFDYERAYATGKRPDITFRERQGLAFVADITCVSDSGLDDANPVEELQGAIERCKTRLGLKPGGMDLQVNGERTKSDRGSRTTLLIPPKGEIETFVRKRIEPQFRKQLAAGEQPAFEIDEPGLHFSVKIISDRYNYIGHPSYNRAESLTQNPLYNALRGKARKLRGIDGIKGVIACDGDCGSMAPPSFGRDNRFGERAIMDEFLRQNRSFTFVLAITVKQDQRGPFGPPPDPKLHFTLAVQPGHPNTNALDRLFRAMAARLPKPHNLPINAAMRAREPGYGWGKHGALHKSNNELKMSARLVMEVLAGKRTIEQLHELQRWRSKDAPQDNHTLYNPFERWLDDGQLPIELNIEADPEGTDDMIVFKVGEPDAAISPFRLPSSSEEMPPMSASGRYVERSRLFVHTACRTLFDKVTKQLSR